MASAALYSVPSWCYDAEGRYISFREDGTGEVLWCACNFSYWIAAEIEWRLADTILLNKAAFLAASSDSDVTSSTQMHLHMTLTKRLPPRARGSILTKSTLVNECSLTDDAFKTKLFTVRVESGRFIEPCRVGDADDSAKTFKRRLVFDPSPYPPATEWKTLERGVTDGEFWKHTEFVAKSD